MITVIAAVAANRVIGKRNDLPWYLPEDLKHFKELTANHPVIMGRNTFDSILARLGKPLPGRQHFVLTRNPEGLNISPDHKSQVIVCTSLEEAITQAQIVDSEVFIIGGEKVFEEGIKIADKLELTEVYENYEGDAFFPEFDSSEWEKTEENHGQYSFATYLKK